MENLVRFIVEQIVDDPSQVDIKRIDENDEVRIEVRVAEEDKGRVIGKNGKVINSIRNLSRVQAAKQGVKVYVEVL